MLVGRLIVLAMMLALAGITGIYQSGDVGRGLVVAAVYVGELMGLIAVVYWLFVLVRWMVRRREVRA